MNDFSSGCDILDSYDELNLQVSDFSDEEMENPKMEIDNELPSGQIQTPNVDKYGEYNVNDPILINSNVDICYEEPTMYGSFKPLLDHNYHKNAKRSQKIKFCPVCYLQIDEINLNRHQTQCRERIFKCSYPSTQVVGNLENENLLSVEPSIPDLKLREALHAIFEGFEINVASTLFGVEENMLKEKLKSVGVKIPPRDTLLQKIIVSHLKILQKKCFKLSEYSIRRIAYELALLHQKVTANEFGIADEPWYDDFIQKYPVLVDLRADFIDRKAMMSYQKLMVLEFFEHYVQLIHDNHFDRNTIYTVETASIVLSKTQEGILDPKNDQKASIIVAANSVGDISPAVISSNFVLNPSKDPCVILDTDQTQGKIDSGTFKKFVINFIKHTEDKKRSFLLLLNENDYYSQSYETYVLLKKAHINVLGVPNILVNNLPLGNILFNKIIGRMQLIIHDRHMDGGTIIPNFPDLFSWGKNLTPLLIYEHLKNGFDKSGLVPIDKENALMWIQETMGKSAKNIFRLVYVEREKIQRVETVETVSAFKQEELETSEYISDKIVQLSEITPDADSYGRPRTPEILERYLNDKSYNLLDIKVKLTKLPEKCINKLKHRKIIKKRPADLSGYKKNKKRKKKIKCPVCDKLFIKSKGDLWIQCLSCKAWSHERCVTLTDKVYFFCTKCLCN